MVSIFVFSSAASCIWGFTLLVCFYSSGLAMGCFASTCLFCVVVDLMIYQWIESVLLLQLWYACIFCWLCFYIIWLHVPCFASSLFALLVLNKHFPTYCICASSSVLFALRHCWPSQWYPCVSHYNFVSISDDPGFEVIWFKLNIHFCFFCPMHRWCLACLFTTLFVPSDCSFWILFLCITPYVIFFTLIYSCSLLWCILCVAYDLQ